MKSSSERDRLGKELNAFPGVKVYPTGANFFLLELSVSPRSVFEELCRQGILVRDVSSYPDALALPARIRRYAP